ncbi:hypothetical protein BH10BDE1_BH10BDE1_13270 [soil metagenome]
MKHKSLLPKKESLETLTCFKSKDEYEEILKKLQHRMLDLQQIVRREKRKVVIVFEGPDAAGKGGVIKRLTEFLDPRSFQVHATGAPTEIERGENYMQRFFASFPKQGHLAIFDRSWYGRVLVERVEGLASKHDWKRAYGEINAIEAMLIADGALVLKYFLDLSYDEQKARFDEREENPLKQWKITKDDHRNRAKWNDYFEAFNDMIENTSLEISPWTLVAADSKWSARVSILRDVVDRAEAAFVTKRSHSKKSNSKKMK